MRRRPKPSAYTIRDLYAQMKALGAPCRQKTQQCLHNGDCALCNAIMGEVCREPRLMELLSHD